MVHENTKYSALRACIIIFHIKAYSLSVRKLHDTQDVTDASSTKKAVFQISTKFQRAFWARGFNSLRALTNVCGPKGNTLNLEAYKINAWIFLIGNATMCILNFQGPFGPNISFSEGPPWFLRAEGPRALLSWNTAKRLPSLALVLWWPVAWWWSVGWIMLHELDTSTHLVFFIALLYAHFCFWGHEFLLDGWIKKNYLSRDAVPRVE